MIAVKLYRKRPVVIEAVRLTSENRSEVAAWCNGVVPCDANDPGLDIPTLEGTMTGTIGDWIIKGVKGEFYPCRGDIFEESYEIND